jgi:hypothetical protein
MFTFRAADLLGPALEPLAGWCGRRRQRGGVQQAAGDGEAEEAVKPARAVRHRDRLSHRGKPCRPI